MLDIDSSIPPRENPFWHFSLALYQDVNIQKACHVLQNTYCANVNLILFAYWLGYAVKELPHYEFTQACRSIATWHEEVTQNLRKARTYLKQHEACEWTKKYYRQLLTDEINSESYQQDRLYNQVKHVQKSEASLNNSMSYQYLLWLFNDMGQKVDGALQTKIHQLIKMISDKLQ